MLDRWSTLLRPKSISIYPVPMVQMGPRTFDGRNQLGAPDAGYWGGKIGFQVYTRDQLLEWRGLIASFEGGLNPFVIGVFDERQAPTPDGMPLMIEDIPHSDGTLFSDGSGYSQSSIEVIAKDGWQDGDVSAVLKVVSAGPLSRGMYFSVADRLSMIVKPPDQSGDEVEVRFWPPARLPVAANVEANFHNPTLTAQLADPKSGAIDLSGMYYGEPTIEIVESFDGV
jgi:hypothetical protein